ncbi:unnamed protein product [Rhizophagus irregularis]|nr:unnamed protein product [Rhizophagus irregularis]CAB5394471.1 unnamed protein product [Rhizophagus irregularis]
MSEEPCPKVQKVGRLQCPISGQSTSGGLSNTSGLFSSEIISDVLCNTSNNKDGQISSFTQVSNDLVIIEPSGQTFPCILESGENFTDIWNEYLHEIDLNSWSVKHDCIVKTFHNKVLKYLCLKADWKQIQGNRLHLAEEGSLERLKPVLQKKNDKQSLLQKFAQVWINMGKGDATLFEQYALLVIHIFINEFTSKRNVISHHLTTEAVKYNNEGKAIRDGDMEYIWGVIVLDSKTVTAAFLLSQRFHQVIRG